jgi:hypothetical protein
MNMMENQERRIISFRTYGSLALRIQIYGNLPICFSLRRLVKDSF